MMLRHLRSPEMNTAAAKPEAIISRLLFVLFNDYVFGVSNFRGLAIKYTRRMYKCFHVLKFVGGRNLLLKLYLE